DKTPDQRALQRAQSADHHHDQGGDEDAYPHGRVARLDRAGDDAGESTERRAEGEDEREHPPDVDPEPGRHFRVVHTGANDGAEASLLDQEPERERHKEAEGDDEETVGREGEPPELRPTGEQPGRGDGADAAAPAPLDQVLEDIDEAESQQYLGERGATVQGPQETALNER